MYNANNEEDNVYFINDSNVIQLVSINPSLECIHLLLPLQFIVSSV